VLGLKLVDGSCTWGARLDCAVPFKVQLLLGLWAAATLVYGAMYGMYLWRAMKQLRQHLYQRYRVLQLWTHLQVCALKQAI
jgi:hypothetical protein